MTKQQIHLSLNELKDMIKQRIVESYLGKYGMSGGCVYEPGMDADITEEEYEELKQYMQPQYSISFNAESSGGDGWNTPDETYNVPSQDDVNAVYADIQKIQNEHLRAEIETEFQQWLDNCDPDMDYNEPDPDRYRDDMMNEDSGYGKDDMWFKSPLHDEPGDEHYEDPEQITRDNDEAWRDHDAMYPSYDARSTEYSDDPRDFPHSNKNAEYEFIGRQNALNAQQNDYPLSRWSAQTERPTNADSYKAREEWFPADTNDTQYTDSTYRVNRFGEIEESKVKNYLKNLVKEAMEDMGRQNPTQFVIQTKTGGYLMQIQDSNVELDENTKIISALVGRTPVAIYVNKNDIETLFTNGDSINAEYERLGKGGEKSPKMPCTIAPYFA